MSLPEPLALNAAVSLEIDGGLVLAEVANCATQGANEYHVQLAIEQVIPSLSELGRLMDAIMQASPRGTNNRDARSTDSTRVERERR